MSRSLLLGGLCAALYIAGIARVVPGALDSPHGRDYASYYYAAKVALHGGDPYHTPSLDAEARVDDTRSRVYPFLYPPPYLLIAAPFTVLPLQTSYLVWFWLNAGLFAATAGALAWAWRGLGPAVPWILLGFGAWGTAVANNHLMGQANVVVLTMTLAGLILVARAPAAGGAWLGLATAAKPTPALIGLVWAGERRWAALLALVAAGAAVAALSLLFGFQPWISFITRVMPSLGDGSYNGLRLSVNIFGNHGFPAFWNDVFPSGTRGISAIARWAALASSLGVLIALGVAWRRPSLEPWAVWARWTCALTVGLLVPTFSYEHHLIYAWPGLALATAACATGRLTPPWSIPVAFAAIAWGVDLNALSALAKAVPMLAGVLGALKFGALLILTAALGRLGATR